MSQALLALSGIRKSFGSVRVLESLDLEVAEGEIHGLIGPNGAGKTTLFNIISGALRPDGGTVKLHGRRVNHLRPDQRCLAGLARTFQIPRPFARMTVFENAYVGAVFGQVSRERRNARAEERAREALRIVGLEQQAQLLASTLSTGQRKMLELARAVATGARLLLLDEVMAGLNPAEVDEVGAALRDLRASGRTLVMVEHVMKAVMGLSDRVSVLFRGKILLTDTPQTVVGDARVAEAYLGSAASVA